METNIGSLMIFDGGSEEAEMIGNLTRVMNHTKISTPRNQIYVVLNTNGQKTSIRLSATVIESK